VEECLRGPETIKSWARCHGGRGIPDTEILLYALQGFSIPTMFAVLCIIFTNHISNP